jgi:uridine kinase
MPTRPIVIAIAGCSGSGKTTLARELATQLDATLFPLDLYYRDLTQFPLDQRDKRNFDHPDSLESELFIAHIHDLAQGHTIQRPIYDFATHSRVAGAFENIVPTRYVLVEGILALHYPELLPLYDFSIYVDAPDEVCLARRIHRDMRERGRTEQNIRDQFNATAGRSNRSSTSCTPTNCSPREFFSKMCRCCWPFFCHSLRESAFCLRRHTLYL